jgi:deoxyribonuclease (pyrimidine dimer)
MTRINADIDPTTLKRPHLLAELREITMIPASLRRSLRTKTIQKILISIPDKFTLGSGHVLYFYNKLKFLQKRFNRLADEMERRGYNPDRSRIAAFDGFDKIWYGVWIATDEDNAIIVKRIAERIAAKPHLYKD